MFDLCHLSASATTVVNMNVGRLSTPQRISAVAILVTAIASFLPWVSFLGLSKLGIEGDGLMTLSFAVAGAVILSLTTGLVGKPRSPGKASQVALLMLAVLTTLVGLLDMNGAAAIGLYLTLFAGVGWAVGSGWLFCLSLHADSTASDSL
jgi:hypothetical protein